jgi:KUP system potassium uptake protein
MVATTVLFYSAAQELWHWSALQAALVCSVFLGIEILFAAANALKLFQGGWVPLFVGLIIFAQMMTWHRGRKDLGARLAESYLPLDLFLQDLEASKLHRVPGTAVFMSGNPHGTPIALLHNLRHNQVLHQRVIILNIASRDVPYVADKDRVKVERLRPDIYRVMGSYGFMEQPSVPALLDQCAAFGLKMEPVRTTYFLSRETILPKARFGLKSWRSKLFAAISRNAQPATAFFQLPPNRVVELGMQVEV